MQDKRQQRNTKNKKKERNRRGKMWIFNKAQTKVLKDQKDYAKKFVFTYVRRNRNHEKKDN